MTGNGQGASFYFTRAINGGVGKRQATATHSLKAQEGHWKIFTYSENKIDIWNRLNRRRVWYSGPFAICDWYTLVYAIGLGNGTETDHFLAIV